MKIKVRMPEGTAVDARALAKGIGEALRAHRGDASKIWRLNDVPAIAQLEEANYGPGSEELTEIFEQVARQLSLPTDTALDFLAKGMRRKAPEGQMGLGFDEEELGPVVKRERVRREKQAGPVQHSLEFDEEAHPRLGAGEEREGFKPGQFVPKEGTEKLHDAMEEDEEKERTPTETAILKAAAWARVAHKDVAETLASDPSKAVLEDTLRRLQREGDAHLRAYQATHPELAADQDWYAQVAKPWRAMVDQLEEALRPFQQSGADHDLRELLGRAKQWGEERRQALQALLDSSPTAADLSRFMKETDEGRDQFEDDFNRAGLSRDEWRSGPFTAAEEVWAKAKPVRERLLQEEREQLQKDASAWMQHVFLRTQQAVGTAAELEAFKEQIKEEARELERRMIRVNLPGEWRDQVASTFREMSRNLGTQIEAARTREAAEQFTLAGPKPHVLPELAIPDEPDFWEKLAEHVSNELGRSGSRWDQYQYAQGAGRQVRNTCGGKAAWLQARAGEARANGDEGGAARLEGLAGAVKDAGEAWKVLLDAHGQAIWAKVQAENERKRQEQEEREARIKAEDEAAAKEFKKNPEGATEWRAKAREIEAKFKAKYGRLDKRHAKEKDPEKRRELEEQSMNLRVDMIHAAQPWHSKADAEEMAMKDFHQEQRRKSGKLGGVSGLDNAWAPQDPPTHQAHWQPGREMTADELKANGLEMRQTLLLTPEEDAALHQDKDMGDGWLYYGPPTKEFLDAAHEEKETTMARLPPQVRQKMADAGVSVHVHAGPPRRQDYPDQAAYFDYLKKGEYANGRKDRKLSWDTVGGFARPWQMLAKSRLGNANPQNPWSSSGSVNVHLHEIAHVLDRLYRQDDRDVSDTPRFRRLWQDFRSHVSDYQANAKYGPSELFAEGLATFLESPENRSLMENGPAPYQRLAKFYRELLNMSEADLRKALRLMVGVVQPLKKAAAPPPPEEGPLPPSRFVTVQVQTPDGHFILVQIRRAEAERQGLLDYINEPVTEKE